MNRIHRWYCRSDRWANTLGERLLPWALGDTDLGPDVLEVGPGPGCVTQILHQHAESWTSIEIDPDLARNLSERMRDTNVCVVEGDATSMQFPDERFSGAVSFTMLHHVASRELQDRLLGEVHRVLRPGGIFVGSDSRTSRIFQLVHLFDTLVPVDPDSFGERLERAGFAEVRVGTSRSAMRFRAIRT